MKNVDVRAIRKFVEENKGKEDAFKRKMKVVIKWNMDESLPQMESDIEYPTGKVNLKVDGAPFAGGKGRAPNPIQYCLFGMASCFLGTFATIAAEKGVQIDEISVTAENEINLKKTLGLGDEPIVKGIKITVFVKSKHSKDEIDKVKKEAMEKCPAVYCITNPIPLGVDLEVR